MPKPLLRLLFCGCVTCIGYPAWCWPPSKEDIVQWEILIEKGDVEGLKGVIEELIKREENINQWVNYRHTSLSDSFLAQAARHGQESIAQLLITHGAIVDDKDFLSNRPIECAVVNNHEKVVRLLLEAGVNINFVDFKRQTLLHVAVAVAEVSMAQFLLDQGAHVEGIDPQAAPLSADALSAPEHIPPNELSDSEESLQSLLSVSQESLLNQLQVSQESWPSQFPVSQEPLLSQLPVSQEPLPSQLPVSQESLLSQLSVSQELLLSQLSVSQESLQSKFSGSEDSLGTSLRPTGTPLYWAASFHLIGMVKLLLRHGADIRNVYGNARASLQDIYTPGAEGIEANFHQYITEHKNFDIPVDMGRRESFSDWLSTQIEKMTIAPSSLQKQHVDLINQAVLLVTLNLPDTLNLRRGDRKPVIRRIESYLISTDFIKEADSSIRKTARRLSILLTDNTGERMAYTLYEDDLSTWMQGMEHAAVLGAKFDPLFYYKYAHHELMKVEYEWERKEDWKASSLHIRAITSRTPLKRYWEGRESPSDDVHINQENLEESYRISKASLDMHLFMHWHRPLIARLMVSALYDSPDLYLIAKNIGCNVYCLGCGCGEDTYECFTALNKKGIECTVTGIDNIEELIIKAKWLKDQIIDYKFSAASSFLKEDAFNLTQWFRTKERNINGGVNIFVAEDFLVHKVLPGAYSALQILHQLIQPEVADLVIIGGVHHPLVSERTACAAGWDVQLVELYHSKAVSGYFSKQVGHSNTKYPAPAFVLKRPDKEQQMDSVYQRSLKRSREPSPEDSSILRVLDLSMSGLPLEALKYYLAREESRTVTQIDLSYSNMDESHMPSVLNLLTGFPLLKHVMASGFEPWYLALLKAIQKQRHFEFVQRKDNQYHHELPSLEPDVARLLGHYTTTPAQVVYTPAVIPAPVKPAVAKSTAQQEHRTGYLAPEFVKPYQQQTTEVLSAHNLQLHTTPADNLCFFNAASMQLGLSTPDLLQILINHLEANRDIVETEFEAFAGEQFDILIDELRSGQWGHAGLSGLLAWIFTKRIVVFYFNSSTGQMAVQVYNPDGSGSDNIYTPDNTGIPNDLNEHDIVLVHNGQGHWLAAMNANPETSLVQHNSAQLSPLTGRESLSPRQAFSPDMVSALLSLLIISSQSVSGTSYKIM